MLLSKPLPHSLLVAMRKYKQIYTQIYTHIHTHTHIYPHLLIYVNEHIYPHTYVMFFPSFMKGGIFIYTVLCLFKISLPWRSLSAQLFSIVRMDHSLFDQSPTTRPLNCSQSVANTHTALQQIKVSFCLCSGNLEDWLLGTGLLNHGAYHPLGKACLILPCPGHALDSLLPHSPISMEGVSSFYLY